MPFVPEEVTHDNATLLNLHHFDQDAMRFTLQRGSLEHVQAAPGRFRGTIAQTASAGLRLDWGEYSLAVLARGDLNPESLSLVLIVGGAGEWRVFGAPAGEGDLLLMPQGGRLHARKPNGAQWLSLQAPRCRFEAMGLDLALLDQCSAWHLPGPASPALRAGLHRLAPVLSPQAAERWHPGVDLTQAHTELLGLLLGEFGSRVESMGAPAQLGGGERWRVVRRAEEYFADHADLRIRIDELCQAVGTSVSRLERAFREVYGLGPQRYLSLRRLAAVRRQLQTGDPLLSVTMAATDWGFFHLGRFAADYHRLFGERPSETLAFALSAGRSGQR